MKINAIALMCYYLLMTANHTIEEIVNAFDRSIDYDHAKLDESNDLTASLIYTFP